MNNSLKFNTCVLFGGNGFIGSHFASYLLEHKMAEKIYIADLEIMKPDMWPKALQQEFAAGRLTYAQIDVRKPIDEQEHSKLLPQNADLIVNLAAVHREPGHQPNEYFETNIPGAENINSWAEKVNCNRILFTSSIAAYGANEDGKLQSKSEDSLPMPLTPYGVSKLTAEKIHHKWQAKDSANRKLLIVRPGVIFGATERGNVTRMVKALLGRYFFYTGNQEVRKAGGYVKELCNAMAFMLNWQDENKKPVMLFNFTMNPAPSVSEYVHGITKVAGVKRHVFNMPFKLILLGSHFMKFISNSINPTRVKKLLRYNNISPKRLEEAGYKYEYTLEEGLADWHKERPEDW